jgi:localization factor PodJL
MGTVGQQEEISIMKPGIPWSVKGIGPEVREAAKDAARRSGMTLGEWLNSVILDQADDEGGVEATPEGQAQKEISRDTPRQSATPADDTAMRLEDIAQQLARLARRDHETAPAPRPEARRGPADDDALARILSRVENNERQTVDAFAAVNDRLSVIGRQVAQQPRARPIERPEDVPGFPALESAIRNVVGHIEVSEKRTRQSLQSLQERMAEMSERAAAPGPAEELEAAPAFVSLEARLNELAERVQRNEAKPESGLFDLVRSELRDLADRIEQVREASAELASQAQSAAVSTAQRELREIEARILKLLQNAQATIASQAASSADLQRLRAEIGSLNQRIDGARTGLASERDVTALRVAVEQLSTRVAQGPDLRPIAEMDRRLADMAQRLEETQAQAQHLPQFEELERRIAELDQRLEEAVQHRDDGEARVALEQQIAAVHDRLGQTEQQLTHFETIEHAISQLYDSIEQTRAAARQTAEDVAGDVAQRLIAEQPSVAMGPSPELQSLQNGLRAVRESAAASDQRSQETLAAVHETLEQIVNKLAELETAAAGHQLVLNMAKQTAESGPQSPPTQSLPPVAAPNPAPPDFFDPAQAFQEPEFDPETQLKEPSAVAAAAVATQATPMAAPVAAAEDFSLMAEGQAADSDDFIAAARRAAQAAATKGPALTAENKPLPRPGANRRFSVLLPFLRRSRKPKPQPFQATKPVPEIKPAPATTKRRTLVLAALVILAAASAITFNMVLRPGKPARQSSVIEQSGASVASLASPAANGDQQSAPVELVDPTGDGSALATPPTATGSSPDVDEVVTGSLPGKKTDASLASIVAEPGVLVEPAEVPPPSVGSLALRTAAQAGNPTAQFVVATRYLDGNHVDQDLTKAAYWYQQAATRGLAPAQYRIATLFERGRGVPQDVATAQVWYERAATAGNVKSMHNAAVIAAGNQVGTPDYDKAFHWFSEAAARGLKDSQFNLAVLYERGLGTKIDLAEADLWYTLAARQGDIDAGNRAAQVARKLSTDEAAQVQQRVTTWTPEPTIDSANVVAVTDQAWNDQPAETVAAAEPAAAAVTDPVLAAQQFLAKLGFDVGQPDGKLGTRTTNAVRLFQLQSGLEVTGEITPELLSLLQQKAS